MPYIVSVTPAEAEVIEIAKVGSVDGTVFTYDPEKSLEIIHTIQSQNASDERLDRAAMRLVGRIATLYGRILAKRNRPPVSKQPVVDLEEHLKNLAKDADSELPTVLDPVEDEFTDEDIKAAMSSPVPPYEPDDLQGVIEFIEPTVKRKYARKDK